MQSIKPAPSQDRKKKVPVPELADDDSETVIEVMDYRKPTGVEEIKDTVIQITQTTKDFSWGQNLETIREETEHEFSIDATEEQGVRLTDFEDVILSESSSLLISHNDLRSSDAWEPDD